MGENKASLENGAFVFSSMISSIFKWMVALVIGAFLGAYFYSVAKDPIPQSQIVEISSHSLAYDGSAKGPFWVQEVLEAKNLIGSFDQPSTGFIKDPNIPAAISSTLADYQNSGFVPVNLLSTATRGPSYLSIVSPQVPTFNSGYWKTLEAYVNTFTIEKGRVLAITGPLYLPHEESNGKSYVTYQVIGPNKVAVPTHFFKAIFSSKNASDMEIYVIPNQEINLNVPLQSFRISTQEFEQLSGIVFPSNLMNIFSKPFLGFL